MDPHGRAHAAGVRLGARPRVALDARWVQTDEPGGIGRMLLHLLPLLREEVDLHLLTDARRPPLRLGLPEHPLTAPPPRTAVTWLQVGAARFTHSFDGVFHCPFYGLPAAGRGPMVASLHDLTFEHRPEWFPPGKRAAFRAQARVAARRARVLLTGSQHVRDDVVVTYGVPPDRVLVHPHAPHPAFRPDRDVAALRARLGLPDRWVVAFGGAPRRGLDRAVTAWRLLGAGPDLPLVVVGPEAPPALPGVVHAGWLADDDLADLLSGAAALLYPTGYEGYGLPAVEAQAAGAPVVAARVGALPEVLGGVASWSASLEAADLADALRAVLDAPGRAADLRARGLARAAAAPGWAEAAAVHVEAYRRAAA